MIRTQTRALLTVLLLAGGTSVFACGGSDAGVGPGSDDGGADTTASSSGASGTSGTSGSSGTSGTSGTSGSSGASGSSGGDGGGDAAKDTGVDVNVPCTGAAPVFPGLKLVPITASTIPSAIYAAQPPGSTDWFVVSQAGRIRIVRAGALLATPFLDISAGIGNNPGERGLLSLAFHPDYATNGRFFVMGSPADGADGSYSAAGTDAVVEFKRSAANADVADPAKVQDIVVMPPSETNHNGGTIMFGPDKLLYVGTGDGGGGCESSLPGVVQDTTKLNGKVLRLDVNAAAPFGAAGNPFANDVRVLHYGVRNPFRYGFDPLTGDFYLGDVGQDTHEEVDFLAAGTKGANFGWPAFEGTQANTCGGKPLGGPSPHTPPVLSVDRGSGLFPDYRAIIGGTVYRGAAIPALAGVYLFADNQGNELGALKRCQGQFYGPVAKPLAQITPSSGGGLSQITAIVQGNDGEVYFVYGFNRVAKLALQ